MSRQQSRHLCPAVNRTSRKFTPSLEQLEDRTVLTTVTAGLPIILAQAANESISPDIAIATNGDMVAVWGSGGIKLQKVLADGTLSGSVTTVSGSSTQSSDPRIGIDSAGNFNLAWHESGAGDVIKMQRFSSSIVPIGTTMTLGNGIDPSLDTNVNTGQKVQRPTLGEATE